MDKLLQKLNDTLNFYFEHLKMNSIRKVFPFNGQLLCKKRETSRGKKKKKKTSREWSRSLFRVGRWLERCSPVPIPFFTQNALCGKSSPASYRVKTHLNKFKAENISQVAFFGTDFKQCYRLIEKRISF